MSIGLKKAVRVPLVVAAISASRPSVQASVQEEPLRVSVR